MLKRRELLKFSPPRPAATEGYWLHVSRQAMACRFEATLPMTERAGVRLAQAALDEIDRLEAQLSIFRETSEVSFINRHAAARAVEVEESLFALLLLCRKLHDETGGAFDITSGPLSRAWGFVRRQGRIPDEAEIERARAVVGSEKLLFDESARALRFARAGVEINLGSIGKGYALDRIAGGLRGRARSVLLSAGSSSLLAIGRGDGSGWLVGVRHPQDRSRRMAVVRMRDVALSTSGSEEQFFEYEGRRYGHIIDPRSGQPAYLVAGVTVITGSAALADALSTAFYVGGRELAESWCAAHPEVLVIMLESDAHHPVIFGSNSKCEVEIYDE